MLSQRGIEANLVKVKAILDMASPKTVKEMQRLTRRVVALNRFVLKAIDKCLPFFKVLKQAFQWTDECEAAFQILKEYLAKPPLLCLSIEEEDLFLYLAVSLTAVNSAMICEVSAHGEDGLLANRGFEKASYILPGSYIIVMVDQPI